MDDLAATIRGNTETINQLWGRIHATVEFRARSAADRDRWSKACEAFHKRYPDLFFPGGAHRWNAFLALDSAEIEVAVTFLEVDPWFFRSGYLKQTIWGRLKRARLSPQHERRLEQVALGYLQKRIYREFWDMVRYVRLRGSPAFWERINTLAVHSGELGIKANWLLLARQNIPVRNWIGREFLRASYKEGYVPNLRLDNPLG